MKKIVAIALILAGLLAGYFGIKKMDSSSAGIKIGDLELKAEDSTSKNTAYFYIGAGVLCLLGGVYIMGKKD